MSKQPQTPPRCEDQACLLEDFAGSPQNAKPSAKLNLSLPDYRLLSMVDGLGDASQHTLDKAVAAFFLQLKEIICDHAFNPLLLELAVIRDRSESISLGDSFVSHFACFEQSEGRRLMSAWKSMVDVMVEDSPLGNFSRLDVVPNPKTYEYVFYASPLASKESIQLEAKPELADEPIIERTSYELPDLVTSNGGAISLPSNLGRMAGLLGSAVPYTGLWMFVVPFFRVIEYAQASINAFWENFGGRPGGCLIGLIQENGEGFSGLRPACIRLSWLLHKGGFVESDVHAREHQYRRDLLRKLGHAVQNPMVSASANLDQLIDALTEEGKAITADVRNLSELARSRFHSALAATRCIDYFMHLGRGGDPRIRERMIEELKRGRTRVNDVVEKLVSEEFLSRGNSPIKLEISLPDGVLLEGSTDAWWLALYLLLKNASEASPRGGAVQLVVSYNSQLERAEIILRNRVHGPVSEALTQRLNAALSGSLSHFPPSRSKARSLGLGVVTAGQIFRALGLRNCCYRLGSGDGAQGEISSDHECVVFELRDIPSVQQ